MDISVYWQTIKKQSKELTGVEKINAGLFQTSSGISPLLEDYIKAVKGGNADKIMKAAKAAFVKTKKYADTVHTKELKTGKKAMNAKQLKSAKIVGDALDKIILQLANVISGQAQAGSFDRDSKDDATKSNEPLDPKMEKAAKAHVALRLKVAKDAKGYLAKYKSEASDLAKFLKMARKAAGDAKSTKQAGDTVNNMVAQGIATRAVDEIQDVVDGVNEHYQTNINKSGSDFMTARVDFGDKDKLPPWYKGDYLKGHNAAFAEIMKHINGINQILDTLKKVNAEARRFADTAESFSMQVVDPAKLIAKLTKIESEASDAFGGLRTNHARVLNVERAVRNVMSSTEEKVDKPKAIGMQEIDARKRIQQCIDGNKLILELRDRIKAIVSNVEDASVRAASVAAAKPIGEALTLMKNFKAEATATLKVINDAKAKLSSSVS